MDLEEEAGGGEGRVYPSQWYDEADNIVDAGQDDAIWPDSGERHMDRPSAAASHDFVRDVNLNG